MNSDFTLETQIGKLASNGCSVFIFDSCKVTLQAIGSLGHSGVYTTSFFFASSPLGQKTLCDSISKKI
jgi:hypothetical protein